MLENKIYYYLSFAIVLLLIGCSNSHKVVSTFGKRKYTKGYYSFFPPRFKEPKSVGVNSIVLRAKINQNRNEESVENNKLKGILSEVHTQPVLSTASKNELSRNVTKLTGVSLVFEKSLLMPGNHTRNILFPDTLIHSELEKPPVKNHQKILALVLFSLGTGTLITGILSAVSKTVLVIFGIFLILGSIVALIPNKPAPEAITHPNEETGRTISPEGNGKTPINSTRTYLGLAGLILTLISIAIIFLGDWFILVGVLFFLVALIFNIVCLCQKHKKLKGFAIAGLIINILPIIFVIAALIAIHDNGGI